MYFIYFLLIFKEKKIQRISIIKIERKTRRIWGKVLQLIPISHSHNYICSYPNKGSRGLQSISLLFSSTLQPQFVLSSLLWKQQQLRDKQVRGKKGKKKRRLQSLGWKEELSHHLTDLAPKCICPALFGECCWLPSIIPRES